MISRKGIGLAGGLAAAFALLAAESKAGITGNLYFTTFTNQSVQRVGFDYNGTAFSLGSNQLIANLPGADGLVFTSDNFLAVGGQGDAVYRVNPNTGAFTSQTAGGTAAFHMMVGPDGTIWSGGIPGTPASYNSTLTINGTAHPLVDSVTGTATPVDTITWTGSDPTKAFFTSSGPGGNGSFGRVDLSTFTTTTLLTSLPAAHGMTYDPFTHDLILFGADHISQIDPNHPTVVISSYIGPSGTAFDQATVDGQGHIFAATNNGLLYFLDISGSGLVGAPSFVASPFLANSLDDVAPLVGPGAPVPEPSSLVIALTGGAVVLGALLRRRRATA